VASQQETKKSQERLDAVVAAAREEATGQSLVCASPVMTSVKNKLLK
jgi:hypothetical protein